MKLKNNILLLLLVGILGATACSFESKQQQRERAISFFIMEMADDYESYFARDFQRIDAEFLENQMAIYEQFAIVQDTTKRRLQLVDRLNLPLSQELNQFRKDQYSIDEVDDLIQFNAKLDQILNASNATLEPPFLDSEALALNQLNTCLSLYNLSVFAIDLSGKEKSYYYHKFELSGKTREAIFEIDHKTEAILSYKELS